MTWLSAQSQESVQSWTCQETQNWYILGVNWQERLCQAIFLCILCQQFYKRKMYMIMTIGLVSDHVLSLPWCNTNAMGCWTGTSNISSMLLSHQQDFPHLCPMEERNYLPHLNITWQLYMTLLTVWLDAFLRFCIATMCTFGNQLGMGSVWGCE